MPFCKPVINVEWLVEPVVVKVLVMLEYAVPAVAEYLQVADSSVVTDKLVWVVPAVKVPVGWPLLKTGGVVSDEVYGPHQVSERIQAPAQYEY